MLTTVAAAGVGAYAGLARIPNDPACPLPLEACGTTGDRCRHEFSRACDR